MISFDFSKPSILRNIFLAFMAFGFSMGLMFPLFANLFVNWKEGMLTWFVLSCIIAGLSIGLFNFWLLNKMLLSRLHRIAMVANAISNNDVSQRCGLNSNDFIGEMAYSFNQMTENLRTMIERIYDVSYHLNKASVDMIYESELTQLGVEQQKQETYQVVNAMAYMNESVKGMSNRTQAASTSVNEANKATEHGGTVVKLTITSINKLAKEVESAAEVIKRLERDSETIGNVLDVIKEIAEQTNLLALNAAIEAARAGENGRGFAVVADEVRTLASRTQESTKKIEETISQLQSAARKAVSVMKMGREQAVESVNQAEQAGNALKDIHACVQNINTMNTLIAEASQKQREQAEKVNQNIEQISSISENVSSGAAKTNVTSSEVGELANQLFKLIGQFKTH